MKSFEFALYAIFVIYFISLNFMYLMLLALAFIGSIRRLFEARYTDFELVSKSYLTIPVSIIIPAFNEELGISNCVNSALDVIYPEFEVIVVNDGSSDRTLDLLREEFEIEAQDVFYPQTLKTEPVNGVYRSRRHPNLWVMDKENGGKADALNAGVSLARYRYVVATDADSIFDPQGLLRIARIINVDPARILGIGGQIRVGNGLEIQNGKVISKKLPRGLPANFQITEYLGSFLGNRVGWSEINSVPVIAGAFAMWRKDIVLELGGMSTETTHEDIEFTLRVHEHCRRLKIPYELVFIPDPIVWTEVPGQWGGLFAQRRRWQRVVNEVFWRFRRMFLNPRYGTVGVLAMPYLGVYEILGPFAELLSYVIVVILLATGALSFQLFGLFLLVSFGLTSIVRIASVFVEQYSFRSYPMSALPRLFLIAFFENFGYRQYASVARMAAFFDVLRGRKTWERVERKGF